MLKVPSGITPAIHGDESCLAQVLEVPSHALNKGAKLDGAFVQGMYQILQGLDWRVTCGHCIASRKGFWHAVTWYKTNMDTIIKPYLHMSGPLAQLHQMQTALHGL